VSGHRLSRSNAAASRRTPYSLRVLRVLRGATLAVTIGTALLIALAVVVAPVEGGVAKVFTPGSPLPDIVGWLETALDRRERRLTA